MSIIRNDNPTLSTFFKWIHFILAFDFTPKSILIVLVAHMFNVL